MSYTIATEVSVPFDEAVERVTEALAERGFGILSQIDVKATLKKKLDKDIPAYLILGACNPPFAYEALKVEPNIGAMLPCNVIVREDESGQVHVSAVDPIASMQAVDNDALGEIAAQVRKRLQEVIEDLG